MDKNGTLNIFIAGVGGQGTLFASRILGNYARLCGMDCKLSEVHGMAQRGGSVVTHVRAGKKIFSPIIAEGTADALLAFEQLEALRYSYMIKKDGYIITNIQKWLPSSVASGAAVYPADTIDKLKAATKNVYTLDALKLAKDAGTVKAGNTVMVGALTKRLGLDIEIMKNALEMTVPQKAFAVNLNALLSGYAQ